MQFELEIQKEELKQLKELILQDKMGANMTIKGVKTILIVLMFKLTPK